MDYLFKLITLQAPMKAVNFTSTSTGSLEKTGVFFSGGSAKNGKPPFFCINYYPYGKLLRKFIGGSGHERYLTTQHERDHETISENTGGTGFDNRGARLYDSDIGRMIGVDALASAAPAWTPYRYAFCNPVMFIDPTGNYEDYYEDDDGNIEWRNSSESQITENGKTLNNIGTSYVSFTGDKLTLNYQTKNLNGDLSPKSFSVNAVSGRPLDNGTFDYSADRQATPNAGPIPEGNYSINPQAVQRMSLMDDIIGTAGAVSQLFGRKVGGWPGGSYSWGWQGLT